MIKNDKFKKDGVTYFCVGRKHKQICDISSTAINKFEQQSVKVAIVLCAINDGLKTLVLYINLTV